MNKEQLIAKLQELGVDTNPNQDGTLKVAQLQLMLDGKQLQQEVADLKELMEDGNKTIATLESRLSPHLKGIETVEHEGKHYRLLIPKSKFQGRPIDLETLRQNPKLVAELLERKSGVLALVEAKTEKAKA